MAEKEYISREETIEWLYDNSNLPIDSGTARAYWTRVVQIKDALIRHIKTIPAADVVEVCRCKDCKHWDEKYKCCIMMGLTALGDSYFYENSFCSRGERKEATP